jgi:hypothetical protein
VSNAKQLQDVRLLYMHHQPKNVGPNQVLEMVDFQEVIEFPD